MTPAIIEENVNPASRRRQQDRDTYEEESKVEISERCPSEDKLDSIVDEQEL